MSQNLNPYLDAINKITTGYPPAQYVDCLHNKTRLCQNISVFQASLQSRPAFGSNPTDTTIAGWDATNDLNLLAEASVAVGLESIGPTADKYNMASSIDGTAAVNATNSSIATITYWLYLEFINSKIPTALQVLKSDSLFALGLHGRMSNERFINGAKRHDSEQIYTGILLATLKYCSPGLYERLPMDWNSIKSDVDTAFEDLVSQSSAVWGSFKSVWSSAVLPVLQAQTSSTDYGLAGDATNEPTPVVTTTWTGQDVANWINEGVNNTPYQSFVVKNAPSCVSRTTLPDNGRSSSGGCFVAGTLIATYSGPVPIEDITEGTQVLTNAIPVTYGIASDEEVINPLGDAALLCGFNNEGAFFTPGHVFHTTTGLRAVDPVLARMENDWIEVGPLRAGHVVYKLSSKDGYDLIPIRSVQVVKRQSLQTHCYGMHLREGSRTYHANGYLVAVNYPEITVKSIARHLARIPKRQRADMLMHIHELQPLLARFGIQTMADILSQELRGKRRREHLPPKSRKLNDSCPLRRITRHYTFHETTRTDAPGYNLPTLKLQQGVVILNNRAIKRARVDHDSCSISWTRPVPEFGFEHGFVQIFNDGLAGGGCVVLSSNAELDTVPDQAVLHSVQFMVTVPCVDMSGALPSLGKYADGIRTTPENYDPWDIIFDKATWPEHEKRTSCQDPEPFGVIAFATWPTDGKVGMFLPILIVPVLDRLCDLINEKYLKPENRIESLYESYENWTPEGSPIGMIELKQCDLLATLADQPKDGSELSMINVTFTKSLGTDIKLPLLFRTIAVQINSNFTELTGCATEFDASKRGGDGARHFLQSVDEVGLPNIAHSLQVMFDEGDVQTYHLSAADGRTPATLMQTRHSMPAPVTGKLYDSTPLSTQDLTNLRSYNSVEVHDRSQTLLHNTMIYHMKEDQRLEFLQINVPKDLPTSLSTSLPDKVKQWIRDVYAPAYVANLLSKFQSKDKPWRNPLTEKEKNKLYYFWTGSGKSCVSKAPEYNQLNALCSTEAMRLIYNTTLQRYIDDGAQKWANLLYEENAKKDRARRNLAKSPGAYDSNISKYCNILNALDPTGNQANGLFDAVMEFAIQDNLSDPYWAIDPDQLEFNRKWLEDGFRGLIIQVITNDGKLDPEMRESLLKDLTDLAMAYDINMQEEAKVIAERMVVVTTSLLSTSAQAMTSIGDGLKAAGRLSSFKGATSVVNSALNKLPDVTRGKQLVMKGAFTLLVTGSYIYTAYNSFANWDKLDTPGRAIAILSTVNMALDIASKAIDLYEDIKVWRGVGNAPAPPLTYPEATAAAAIDNYKLDRNWLDPITTVNEKSPLQVVEGNASQYGAAGKKVPGRLKFTSDLAAGDPLTQNPKPEIPDTIADPAANGYKTMSRSARILNGLAIVVGVLMTVAMSFDLKNHWNNYNDAGKALNIIQIVTSGLTVLVDAAILVADIALGAAAATSTMLIALPILGAVLALIGLVITIVMMFVKTTKAEDPPQTPVEKFLADTAHPLLATWSDPPPLSLTYEVTQNMMSGSLSKLNVKMTNNTSQKVTLEKAKAVFDIGNTEGSIFITPKEWEVAPNPEIIDKPGEVGALPKTLGTCRVEKTPRDLDYDEWNTWIDGPPVTGNDAARSKLSLDPAQSVTVQWYGFVNKAGKTVLNIIEYLEGGDNCRYQADITRS